MDILHPSEVMESMLRHYRRKRRGWRMLTGPDGSGFQDIYFCAPGPRVWQIKGEFVGPWEFVGAGMKVRGRKIDEVINSLAASGRPLPFGMVSAHPRDDDSVIVASGVGSLLEEQTVTISRKADRRLKSFLLEMRRNLEIDRPYL